MPPIITTISEEKQRKLKKESLKIQWQIISMQSLSQQQSPWQRQHKHPRPLTVSAGGGVGLTQLVWGLHGITEVQRVNECRTTPRLAPDPSMSWGKRVYSALLRTWCVSYLFPSYSFPPFIYLHPSAPVCMKELPRGLLMSWLASRLCGFTMQRGNLPTRNVFWFCPFHQ